jgi:hypothetical protein
MGYGPSPNAFMGMPMGGYPYSPMIPPGAYPHLTPPIPGPMHTDHMGPPVDYHSYHPYMHGMMEGMHQPYPYHGNVISNQPQFIM